MARRHVRRGLVALATAGALVGLCACTSETSDASGGTTATEGNNSEVPDDTEAPKPQSEAILSTNVGSSVVPVDTPVTVKVEQGTLEQVTFKVKGAKAALAGAFNQDKTQWVADELLEPGTKYVVKARAVDAAGLSTKTRDTFNSENLTLDDQTYASVSPLEGETVGVGMPVIVTFDIPVTDRAAFERRMHVTASPAAKGTWHWYSDTEAHWRPKQYWKPGTDVSVDLDLNGVNAGNGIYGQEDRQLDFTIGESVVMRANLQTHQMKVYVGGGLARTIPITGGKDGWETRSGVKLIVEKFEVKRMNAATVGIEPGDPEYYNIPDVEYAQRVTYTGEFLHAAPWSTSDQGSTNVSHGCVGMSTENAAWLYNLTHRGDPVEVTGTDRALEEGNGWTDWNVSYADYKSGSALS
jgi:lipoprotein-anchoring transpeptidase ErfK/SrfK